MRFTIADWARLVLANVLVWVAMSLSATGMQRLAIATRREAATVVTIALAGLIVLLILELLRALAQWLVLRHCLTNLRFGPWLLANAQGLALGLAVVGLAMAFLSGISLLRLLFGGLGHVAYFLPLVCCCSGSAASVLGHTSSRAAYRQRPRACRDSAINGSLS